MTRYASAAKSKAAGLIDRLSKINLAGTINEVALHKLEREAQQLMPADAAGSHAVLGGVASLRWNVEGVHDHYRIALQHLDTPGIGYKLRQCSTQRQRADYEIDDRFPRQVCHAVIADCRDILLASGTEHPIE